MTPLCGLVEGPRGTFLKSEDNGDSGLDWDPAEVVMGTKKNIGHSSSWGVKDS